jgi:hypothetical protein
MFDRLISIDWSGANSDDARVGLRIAQWTQDGATLIAPPSRLRARSWSRNEVLAFLTRELHPEKPRTAVALDFAFGLPIGSDTELFRVAGWRPMLRSLRDLYYEHGTARATAIAINNRPDFQGHGPYRFNDGRADFRFYLRHGVPYYRLIELVMPQAISVWYVGSGAQVGFHTITGLTCLATLLDRRDEGLVDFTVWPHEGIAGPTSGHVLLEGYPAVFPTPVDFGPCRDQDERDAWRMLEWMRATNAVGQLEHSLQLPIDVITRLVPDGLRRVLLEGWILGVL